jgi:hypothetical protein
MLALRTLRVERVREWHLPGFARHWPGSKTGSAASLKSAKSSASRRKPEGSERRGSKRKAVAAQNRQRSPESVPPRLPLPYPSLHPHRRTSERQSRCKSHRSA